MSRKAVLLSCTEKEKQQPEKWVNGRKPERRLHERAQIVLSCLDGKTNLQFAEEMVISRFTVAKWRNRFAKKYDPAIRNKILQTLG